MKKLHSMALILSLAAFTAPSGAVPPPATPAPASKNNDANVRKALDDEMARTLSQLKLGSEAPPYFVRYTVVDGDRSQVSARLGELVELVEQNPSRAIHAELRVGTPDEDNSNFVGSSLGGSATVTRDDDYDVLRRDLWQLSDLEYKDALAAFARKRASKAVQTAEKDRVPDFSKAPPLQLVTNKATTPTDPDRARLKEITLKLSAVFRDHPKVDDGRVFGVLDVTRRRILTSEKTWTDERRSRVRIDVHASTVANDGEQLAASVSFTASDVGGLPALDKMEADVRTLAKNLGDLRTAPQVDPGVASVLFEGPAAAQLARLLLAAPFSGQPIPRSPGQHYAQDGSNSFADRVGLVVAPRWLSVIDDPTGTGPGKRLLAGGYDSDDEGVAAEKITLVDHGVVKALLMSRAPRKEFPKSNGHGRGTGAIRAAASNLFVTATGGLARSELLTAAVRSAGPKGSVYVVRQLAESSGIGRGQTIQAKIAFRYKDGKEEAVRGLSLEGFAPKKMKKDLVAAGRDPIVVDDYTSSVVTPALLFEDVDVGKPNDKNRTPPLYPSPLAAGVR